jgi:hypothetical protein
MMETAPQRFQQYNERDKVFGGRRIPQRVGRAGKSRGFVHCIFTAYRLTFVNVVQTQKSGTNPTKVHVKSQ